MILFFLVGILLVIVATTERRIFPRCIYILGCVAFMFAAGEEISWGQRIFDFETLENLMNLNQQNEFNIHNTAIEQFILGQIFNKIYIYGTFVFCIIICAAFFCNKNTLLGIPLPSIPLMLSFFGHVVSQIAISLQWRYNGERIAVDFYHLPVILK